LVLVARVREPTTGGVDAGPRNAGAAREKVVRTQHQLLVRRIVVAVVVKDPFGSVGAGRRAGARELVV
jgi:hypothetical protein